MPQGSALQQAAAEIRHNAVRSRIADYPAEVQKALFKQWQRDTTHKPGENPATEHYIAGIRLSDACQNLKDAHVGIAFDEHHISLKAKRCAYTCLKLNDLDKMEAFCEGENIEPPTDAKDRTPQSRMARMADEKWWRRQLHRYYSRRAEGELREMGLVNKRRGLYCSDSTLNRRIDQKQRQREMMREVIATNDLGEQFTLFDLAKASVANPAVRRAELMTRIRGFEEVATLADHVAEFYTFTTPSRFHAYGTEGRRNDRYESKLTPRDAQLWLRDCWSRIRAKLHRLSVRVYGFRVAEPHHDGTTHWHLLLFMQRKHRQTVRTVCSGYLLADSGDEPGATRHRFVAVSIDPAKGTAAGYVAKYIAKNIDGFQVGEDFESEGRAADETAARVDAWASTWGIRQFQQIGGPPVGVWRELRRVESLPSDAALVRAAAAADAGEWAEFIAAFGGIDAGRNGVVELHKEQTGEVNQYGELKAAAVAGVKRGLIIVITRIRQWVFSFIDRCAPWTRVNNCTAADFDEYATFAGAGPP